jgi:hypothetical protein
MSLKETHEFNIVECSWEKVRKQAEAFEPELCAIINKLDLTKNHKMFKITYPFGARILEKGIFYLPKKQDTKPSPSRMIPCQIVLNSN